MSDKKILFTALKVPEDFRSRMELVYNTTIQGRWAHPDDLHITIRYLGSVETARLEEIKQALQRVRCKPFGVEVSGLAFFENRKHKALYADIKSTRKLNNLCAEVTDALAGFGFDFGTRPFQPHITLARLDKKVNLTDFINKNSGKVNGSWETDSFFLFESSHPDQSGARYRELARFDLG